jgi:hypothetical protein
LSKATAQHATRTGASQRRGSSAGASMRHCRSARRR